MGLGSHVEGFDAATIGTGQMAENIRFGLRWSDDDPALPRSVVGKFPSPDPRSRAAGQMGAYAREVGFYRDLQRLTGVPTPRVLYLDFDDETADFALLMNDVQPARTGDQLVGCDLADARLALDAIVGLHASTWGQDGLLSGFAWLPVPSPELIAARDAMYQEFFQGFCATYASRLSAEDIEIGRWIGRNLTLLTAGHTLARCAVHNDFRLDNLLFATGDGPAAVTVVDWQTLGVGYGPVDLAYFVGAGVQPAPTVDDERDLVDHYCRRLAERGVTVDAEQAWASYRLGTASGYAMAVLASQLVVRTERGDDMFVAMASRHAAQMRRVGLTQSTLS